LTHLMSLALVPKYTPHWEVKLQI